MSSIQQIAKKYHLSFLKLPFFSDVQLYGTASRGEKVDKTSYQFEGNKTFLKINTGYYTSI